MDPKNTYIAAVENQLDKWKSEIQKFRIIAEVADKDAQIEHYKIIENISDSEHVVVNKLDQLKESSNEQWEQLKIEIDKAQKQVNDAIEAARTKIN